VSDRVKLGMVHGRFQPFHSGHLEYLRAAAGLAERLLVGITNPDRFRLREEAADRSRHTAEANPFTYTERLMMVDAVLRDERIAALVVPFPVSQPELWPDYVPAGTVHFVRVFDDWGAEKVDRLRAAGFEVRVLDRGARKRISGTEVRALIRSGGRFEELVPPAVAGFIGSLAGARALDLPLAS
jgi:nicotinamide-nucleotide adenylyltransferase